MSQNNQVNSPFPTAINKGGTGVTSVTTAPTASSWAGWDANKNMSANNFIPGYTTTATAASTTVLTVASTWQQYFTGSTTQTVTLPVTSTLVLGQSFYIVNNSSGNVTVNSSGGNAVQVMTANTTLLVTCILTSGTTAASWATEYVGAASGGTVNSGLINQLAWYAASGTAVSGLTTSASGVLVTSAGSVPSISTTLPSGLSATNLALTTPSLGTPTSGTLTSCTGLPLTSGVTGILPIANGGTGVSSSKPIIQEVYTITGAVSTGTTIIPGDDTIPQSNEGTQFMTLAITPTNVNNLLIIEVQAQVASSAALNYIIMALFQDSTANALQSSWIFETTGAGSGIITMQYIMAAGTTSATTFKIRIGGSSASTITFNGAASARFLGGTLNSYMKIQEVTV